MQRLKFLTYNTDGHVAVVNLAHPPVNAVTETMYQEIRHLFGNTAEYLPDARAIVLTGGESKHFCGGSDLNGFAELTPENAPERMRTVREAFWAIYDCPLPVIAAVHGAALGTGLAIAASCDMVIAAEGAKIGLPEVAVGMMGAPSTRPVWCRLPWPGCSTTPLIRCLPRTSSLTEASSRSSRASGCWTRPRRWLRGWRATVRSRWASPSAV